MKFKFASLAAALLIGTAPAALVHAQPVSGDAVDTSAVVSPHGNWTLRQREDWLYSRLDKARDDGSLGGDEFEHVHHDIDQIRADEDSMRDGQDGQLNDNQTAMLETRLDGVADQIHWIHENNFRRPW